MGYDAMRPNRRNGRRWNVMWTASIVIEGQTFPCTILDLSRSGARLEGYGLCHGRSTVQLQCEQFGTLGAKLQWVRGGRAGVRFEKSPAEIIEILRPLVPGMGRQEVPRATRAQRATFGRMRVAA